MNRTSSLELNTQIFQDPQMTHLDRFSLEKCETLFKEKGGQLNVIKLTSDRLEGSISLEEQDAVYPICSGAICRSQALYCLLRDLIGTKNIILFPPHASRWGYDPYHDQIPRQKKVKNFDEFELVFGHPRIERFGFSDIEKWMEEDNVRTEDALLTLKSFYDHYYYGPESHYQYFKGNRRIYIAFAHPVHAVLKRLIETNSYLHNVVLVAIPLEDEITHPPSHLQVPSCSQEAYQAFLKKIRPIFDIKVK